MHISCIYHINIRYWSWNYRGCWHQTCPPIDPRGYHVQYHAYIMHISCIYHAYITTWYHAPYHNMIWYHILIQYHDVIRPAAVIRGQSVIPGQKIGWTKIAIYHAVSCSAYHVVDVVRIMHISLYINTRYHIV